MDQIIKTKSKNKQELLNFFFDFHDLLEKHNLWYIAEFGTLLGAVREGKMIEWDDDIDLAISYDTYLFLKKNFPNNLLTTDVKGYPFVFAKWVPNVNDFMKSSIFIDLFILIPTCEKKFKKFSSNRYIWRFATQMFSKKTKYIPQDKIGKTLKIILWPIQWFFKKITIESNIEMLRETENNSFVLLVNLPIYPKSGISSMKRSNEIWDRKKIKFHNKYIYIPSIYNECLLKSYGDNYMTPIMTNEARVHIDPLNSIPIKKSNKI